MVEFCNGCWTHYCSTLVCQSLILLRNAGTCKFQPIKNIVFIIIIKIKNLISVLAWAIIPLQFEYRNHYFFFRSWNLFVLVCALPAEILGVWLIFCPETPKYLAESGQTGKLMKVLTDMYIENIKGTPEEFYVREYNQIVLINLFFYF